MAGDAPTIVIDVDVNGTEKIEEVAKATKKVSAAQTELERKSSRMRRSFREFTNVLSVADSSLSRLVREIGFLATATTPLVAGVGILGFAISALNSHLEANRAAIEAQRERFEKQVEIAAAARAEFDDLTASILENGEVMRKYGIQFDGTIASITAGIAGLKSAKYSANLKANADKNSVASLASFMGGYDKLDAEGMKEVQREARTKAFNDALNNAKSRFGEQSAKPFGDRIPFLSDMIDATSAKLGLDTEEGIKMKHVFRESGYREGETGEQYSSRRIAELTADLARKQESLQGVVNEATRSAAQKDIQRTENQIAILRDGFGAYNPAFTDTKTQAIMVTKSYLENYAREMKTATAEQPGETKKKIERAKKVESALNSKSTGKTTKQPPPGVWDTNTMGAIKYADLTGDDAKNAPIINISNTIDVSGLDPNNAEEMANEIARRIGNSLLPYVNSGGGMF